MSTAEWQNIAGLKIFYVFEQIRNHLGNKLKKKKKTAPA